MTLQTQLLPPPPPDNKWNPAALQVPWQQNTGLAPGGGGGAYANGASFSTAQTGSSTRPGNSDTLFGDLRSSGNIVSAVRNGKADYLRQGPPSGAVRSGTVHTVM